MPPIPFTGNSSDFLKIGVAAAAKGDIDRVRLILRSKPNWIHHVGSHGRTMLWEACHRGKLSMVKYLVRRKANIDAFGTHYTPYFVDLNCYCISRHKRHHEVADYLKGKGAKSNIHMAAFLGDLPSVKRFLGRSKRRLDQGHPQFVMAPKNDQGLEFVAKPADWATPLVYALRGGDIPTIRFLLERGATTQGIEEKLFVAANDVPERVELLLDTGVPIEFAPKAIPGDPLHTVLKRFGQAEACQNTLNDELVYLCRGDRGGNPADVLKLLESGANVNHRDHKGKTALHRASKAGFIDTIQILLAHGADLEIQDSEDETPLFDAVRSTIKSKEKKIETIQLLVSKGASTTAKNRKSKSVFEILDHSRIKDACQIRAALNMA